MPSIQRRRLNFGIQRIFGNMWNKNESSVSPCSFLRWQTNPDSGSPTQILASFKCLMFFMFSQNIYWYEMVWTRYVAQFHDVQTAGFEVKPCIQIEQHPQMWIMNAHNDFKRDLRMERGAETSIKTEHQLRAILLAKTGNEPVFQVFHQVACLAPHTKSSSKVHCACI